LDQFPALLDKGTSKNKILDSVFEKMKLNMINTLTFDVVGTLIDFETGILKWFQTHLEKKGLKVEEEEILMGFARTEAHYLKTLPQSSFTGLLPVIFSDMMSSWGFSSEEEDGLNFQDSIQNWPPFPDTIEALNELKKHYRLIAVSNCDSSYLKWMSLSMNDPFDEMVSSDIVGINKPDKRLFKEVLKRLNRKGVVKEEILHVAQSQFHDIVPISEIGWSSAWIHRRLNCPGFGATPKPYKIVKPTLNIQSLKDLVEILNQNYEDESKRRKGTFSLRVTFNDSRAA
jgi:putative hydrolase of the HAD superfamily